MVYAFSLKLKPSTYVNNNIKKINDFYTFASLK